MLQLSESPERTEFLTSGRLEEAQQRLDQAFMKLETVVANVAAAEDEAPDPHSVKLPVKEYQHLKREVESLRGDNAKLRQLLQETESNYARLQRASKSVSGKLNHSIGKLKFMLEG